MAAVPSLVMGLVLQGAWQLLASGSASHHLMAERKKQLRGMGLLHHAPARGI